MGERTSISWTHHTFNPWWGCAKISPACDNCYAESWAKRTGDADLWGTDARRRFFSERHWHEPFKWNCASAEAGERRRVFCASMADVFDNHPDVFDTRQRLWALIRMTPHLDWLLLTKRVGNVWHMLPSDWRGGYENVWLGITVCNQAEASRDVPRLMSIPARVRFLSCEPLLGLIDLRGVWTNCREHDFPSGFCVGPCPSRQQIDWVIAGGESGSRARPMHPSWIAALRDQCVTARVAFHFKQWGQWEIASAANGHHGSVMPETGERYTWVAKNGKTFNPSAPDGLDCWAMAKVGKDKAGRTLDGQVWDEFPKGLLVGDSAQ